MAEYSLVPPRAFVRNCRRHRKALKVIDSLGTQLTGGRLLLGALVLRRLLVRRLLAADEQYVGILLPPSAGAVLLNAALPLAGRIAVNLNYTLTAHEINYCIQQCGIRHVITSRRMMDKLGLQIDATLVYAEDLRRQIRWTDKLAALLQARLLPLSMLERRLGLDRLRPDDVLTVIFTSGTTSLPKGVQLTHANIASNVHAMNEVCRLDENDALMCVLPFFHSLGYTATLWSVLMLPPRGIYHTSPLEAKQIGQLCYDHAATILIGTPTFLRNYLKRVPAEHFAKLDLVIAGAEKLPCDLCDAFEQKYGVRPVEGYGTTELSPLVSVNIPANRSPSGVAAVREGSVGRPIPGVEVRIVDPETWADLPVGQDGMLLVRGPNVMKGYLHQPEKTAEVLRDGWYVTGDIAHVDEEGYIFITGRLSRFSKIGGEMVPHLKVEEALQQILNPGADELVAAVTSVNDPRRGERLVVVHAPIDHSPEEICRALKEAGLPNLYLPSPDSFIQVDAIPVLGSGKLDLRRLKQVAEQHFGEAAKK
jgi:acyl-[acyl-carrier-protein]-phospholipid O-acyltransferase/long-chain-fatty-acid--[acyl-carrier-protein] ligase